MTNILTLINFAPFLSVPTPAKAAAKSDGYQHTYAGKVGWDFLCCRRFECCAAGRSNVVLQEVRITICLGGKVLIVSLLLMCFVMLHPGYSKINIRLRIMGLQNYSVAADDSIYTHAIYHTVAR